MAFAKLKAFLRAARPRTFDDVCELIQTALALFLPDECANYVRHCGYPLTTSDQKTLYRFVMRCWTRTELESVFERSGFGSVAYFGAYDPAVHAGATDRLVAVAQVSDV
jgi:hypothetical protein